MQITLFIDSRQNGEIEGVLFSAVSRRRPPNTPVAQPTSAFKSGLFVYTKKREDQTSFLFFFFSFETPAKRKMLVCTVQVEDSTEGTWRTRSNSAEVRLGTVQKWQVREGFTEAFH